MSCLGSGTTCEENHANDVCFMATSYEEISNFMYNYEVKHTVKFIITRSRPCFNEDYVPWADLVKDPVISWGGGRENTVKYCGKPFIIVSQKAYQCQFGPSRHKPRNPDSKKAKESLKLGCPVRANISEILRVVSPCLSPSATASKSNSQSHRDLSTRVKEEIKRLRDGKVPNEEFVFQREFHLSISAISAHSHPIGEAAGPHMLTDQKIKDHISELVDSGVSAIEDVKDKLDHYVSKVLFRDKSPPHPLNARFYPSIKAIRHYVTSKQKQKKVGENVQRDQIIASSTAEPESILLEISSQFENSGPSDTNSSSTYAVVYSHEQLEQFVMDYEIEHTVKFVHRFGNGPFNTDYVPWLDKVKETLPRVTWGAACTNVRFDGRPFINVANKTCHCMFGPQRHKIKGSVESLKINCPAKAEVYEVLKLVSPCTVSAGNTGQRKLAIELKNEMQRKKNGESQSPKDFIFQREFHINITPINAHNHATGEAAGPHMCIDKRLKARIVELVTAGFGTTAATKEKLKQYVEDDLFKDKIPPHPANTRFYPSMETIHNHVCLARKKNPPIKVSLNNSREDDGQARDENRTSQVFTLIKITGAVEEEPRIHNQYIDDGNHNIIEGQQLSVCNKQQGCQQQHNQPNSQDANDHQCRNPDTPSCTPMETQTHKRKQVSGQSATQPAPKKSSDLDGNLVCRVTKVAEALNSMTKHYTGHTNVVMLSKPMISGERLSELCDDLVGISHVKPLKEHTPKPKTPRIRKKRVPEANPNCAPLCDKRAVRNEIRKDALRRKSLIADSRANLLSFKVKSPSFKLKSSLSGAIKRKYNIKDKKQTKRHSNIEQNGHRMIATRLRKSKQQGVESSPNKRQREDSQLDLIKGEKLEYSPLIYDDPILRLLQ